MVGQPRRPSSSFTLSVRTGQQKLYLYDTKYVAASYTVLFLETQFVFRCFP